MAKTERLRRGIVVGILLVAVVLTACQSTQPKATEVPKVSLKKTVTFQHYFSGSLSGGIDTMVAKLNGATASFEVKAIPIDHEAYKVMIYEALKGKNTADLYSYWAGARTQSVVPQLEPVDDIWKEKKLDEVFPTFISKSASTYEGKKYLIPITQHYVGMAYNKAIFQKLHLSEPKTWAEFEQTCAVLKHAGVTPIALGSKSKWPAQFWFDYLLLRTAPLDYREKLMTGQAHYTDPQVAKAFEMWKGLIDRGYFNSKPNELDWDSGAGEMVYNGKAAMTLMGTWLIGYFGDDVHRWQLGTDYDYFKFPVVDARIADVALGPIDGIVIPAHSVNKTEAKSVIAYFSETETQKVMSQGSGAFAPSQRVEDSFYDAAHLRLLKTMRSSPNWAFNYDLSTPPQAADIGLNAFSDFVEFPSDYKMILQVTDEKMRSALGD